MVKNNALEKILDYISTDYKVADIDIQPVYKVKRGVDNNGLKIFYDKKITDYYSLEINADENKHIVKVSWFDKLRYNSLSSNAKAKFLDKLNLKYLQKKEDELEHLVNNEKLSNLEQKTNEIYSTVNSISGRLNDNLNYEEILNKIDELNEKLSSEINNGNGSNNYNKRSRSNGSLKRGRQNYEKQNYEKRIIERRESILNDYVKNNPNKRLIIYLNDVPTSDFSSFMSEISEKISHQYPGTSASFLNSFPIMALNGEPKDIERIAKNLGNKNIVLNNLNSLGDNIIRSIEFDNLYFLPEIGTTFNLKRYNNDVLWNLKNIGADIAQQIVKGEGIKVGVIDTGIDYNHKELINCFDKNNLGFNFIDNSNDPFDDNGHGTHVAGTISGNKVGVAPKAQLFGLKVLDSSGVGSTYNVMAAVNWAMNNNLDIINLSLGSSTYLYAEQELFTKAFQSGVLTIASAGNSYGSKYNYPASYNNVISVAAVDRNNRHADFSTHNDMVDISAPGVNVLSSLPNDKYAEYSGTSMSAPHVSGVSALIKSYERLLPEDIENLFFESSMELGDSDYYGMGLVKADEALDLIDELFSKKRRR